MDLSISPYKNWCDGTTKINFNGLDIDLKTPWPRISVREACLNNYGIDITSGASNEKIRELLGSTELKKERLLEKLVNEKIEPLFMQPTFLTDFPVEYITHGKAKDDNNCVVEGAEAFIAGGLEIASVGAVNNDPNVLRKHNTQNIKNKFGEKNIMGNLDEDYLLELCYGLPPLSGVGIGIDRLIMVLCGKINIDETLPYPYRG